MKISPARIAAFEILSKIENEKAFSSILLPIYEKDLSFADRALCHELTLGLLRKQIYLDKIIDAFTNDKKLDSAVRIALRIGLYQLLFLDKVPSYSAINESVNLVQSAKKKSAKGLVNAILRRATRESIEFQYEDEIERISVETSHPRWLLEKWIGQLGIAETEKLSRANNDIPQAAFRFTRKFHYEGSKTNRVFRKSEYVIGCYFADSFDTELRVLAESGEIYFQDEASQLVASSLNLKDEDKFLDLCAAPGSKTTQIAATNKTRLIAAGELHEGRVRFLRENCRKQGVSFVNVLQYDAEKWMPFADESFDVVLLDAPCSGTGTIRHNPEIRYFVQPSDIGELSGKQLAILQNASKLVKLGGKLVYSTCSLENEENEGVATAFVENNRLFKKAEPNLPVRFYTSDGFARTFPHRDGMDGFFIASFERI